MQLQSIPVHDLESLLECLDVEEASEVCLDDDMSLFGVDRYVARSHRKRIVVDRRLAVMLRADGAWWQGDVVRDPCAVA